MENEFIPYEQALALKELGFDEPCLAFYYGNKLLAVRQQDFKCIKTHCNKIFKNDKLTITAPLYQQAFRWFREKYFLEKQPLYINENTWRVTDQEEILMKNTKILQNIHTYKDYPTHEEAELACLKKLIEIVKNK